MVTTKASRLMRIAELAALKLAKEEKGYSSDKRLKRLYLSDKIIAVTRE
jgi:hypothetical protein